MTKVVVPEITKGKTYKRGERREFVEDILSRTILDNLAIGGITNRDKRCIKLDTEASLTNLMNG